MWASRKEESRRLDGKEDERRCLELGVSKTAITKITGVSRPTLYSFIRGHHTKRKKSYA